MLCPPCHEKDTKNQYKCIKVAENQFCDKNGKPTVVVAASGCLLQPNMYENADGKCSTCLKKQVPNATKKGCMDPTTCNGAHKEFKDPVDGLCKQCPKCQEPHADGTKCQNVSDVMTCWSNHCDWSYQIVDFNGLCKACDACTTPYMQ